MSTDEHTTTDAYTNADNLRDTIPSLDDTSAASTLDAVPSPAYIDDEDDDYDELAATGVLTRDAIAARLTAIDIAADADVAQPDTDATTADAPTDDAPADDAPAPQALDAVEDGSDVQAAADAADAGATTAMSPADFVALSSTDTAPSVATPTPSASAVPSVREDLLSLPSFDSDVDASAPVVDAEPEQTDDTASLAGATEEQDASAVAVEARTFELETPKPRLFSQGTTSRRVLKVCGITAGSLAAVYLAGGLYFHSHFMPHTLVNGEDVSLWSVDALAQHVVEKGQSFSSHVNGDGIDITIAASDIDLTYDGTSYGLEAASQIDPWKWPVRIFSDHDFRASTGIAFDQAKVDAIVGVAVDTANNGAQPPTNATMAFDEAQQKFAPVPDALGTMVDRDHTIATVSEGIRTLQTDVSLGDDDLTQPTVRVDDERLLAVIDRANDIAKEVIPLRIAGQDAGTVDITLIKSWLITNENCELAVNVEAVRQWVDEGLAPQFTSVGSERKYTRADGKEVTVVGGDYGWSLDAEALANVISMNLQASNTDPIDVPMASTAVEWNPGGPDWGKRYIDVDMSEQHVRVYDETGNMVIESDCVTGIPAHATDEGVYSIFEHTANMTLVGLDYNGDGKPDYETPVSYWMPFNGGQGLHDAYWRYSFGGTIWQYDGSHGCVNLPTDIARQLFEWSHVGDVVVVHW